MNVDFWVGVLAGIGGTILLMVIASAQFDTLTSATKRGFYTYENKLYVISPASPMSTHAGVTE